MDVYAEKHSNLWGAPYMMEEVLRRCLANTSFPSIPLYIGTSGTSKEVRRCFLMKYFFSSLFLVLFEKDQKVFHNSPTPLVAYERLQPLLNPRQSLARTKTRRCAHATSSYVLVRRDDAVIYLYIKTHAGPLMVRAFLNVRATSRSG